MATLTAAMKMALGHRVYGVMAGDDAFRERVVEAAGAGRRAGVADAAAGGAAPQPGLPVADIADVGERMGGGLVAGLFLREFVPDGVAWAHLDIAGPAFHEGAAYGHTPRGGTGAAVRTLVRLAQDAALS